MSSHAGSGGGCGGGGGALSQPLFQEPPAFVAARLGDVDGLRQLPRESYNAQFRGMHPLHYAAGNNQLAAMDFLVSIGGQLDVLDQNQRTPLMHAVTCKSEEAVVWLIRRGADPFRQDFLEHTVVQIAMERGNVRMLALLSNLGVDVEGHRSDSFEPLALAVLKGDLPMVEYLMLTRGSSERAISIASRLLALVDSSMWQEAFGNSLWMPKQRPAVSFWTRRCLLQGAGCHDKAKGDGLGGPLRLAFATVPWRSWVRMVPSKLDPEQVLVMPRQLSIISGVVAIFVALGYLWYLRYSTDDDVELLRSLCWVSLVCTLLGSVSWCRAANASPGVVDSADEAVRQRYKEALDAAAAVTAADAGRHACHWWGPAGQRGEVIHQLAMIGPQRSRYCKGTRKCILVFDHYCVFLRGPVGQGNYGSFLGTVVFSEIACLCLVIISTLLFLNDEVTWLAACAAVYFGMFASAWLGVTSYHLFLALLGLTTKEQMEVAKGPVPYLLSEDGAAFHNPYNKGCLRNLCERTCLSGGAIVDGGARSPP